MERESSWSSSISEPIFNETDIIEGCDMTNRVTYGRLEFRASGNVERFLSTNGSLWGEGERERERERERMTRS